MKLSILSLLIKRQFRENYQLYGIFFLVLFGMLSFMFLLIHQWQDSFAGAVQNGVFIIGLFVGGGVFTSTMFHEFSTSSGSIWLLGLPATHGEKLVSSIFMSTVFFIFTYLIIFYLTDALYLLNTIGLKPEFLLNPFKDEFYTFFLFYLLFNGALLLGRVMFTKHSLIKTLLLCILFFVVFNFMNNLILETIIPEMNVTSSIPFDSFQFVHLGENVKVFLPPQIDFANAIYIRLILPCSLWFLVWLKLKEKQV